MKRITIGERVKVELPHSEVCMHMRVAGKPMIIEMISPRMAQIYSDNGHPFSIPVTLGEAGIYTDSEGHYVYEHSGSPQHLHTPEAACC